MNELYLFQEAFSMMQITTQKDNYNLIRCSLSKVVIIKLTLDLHNFSNILTIRS